MSFLTQLRHSLDLAAPRVVESPQPDLHDRYLGLLIFSTVLAVYLKTIAPTVAFGDSGELVTAAVTLGVPGSPGYPLYLIIGKLFTLVLPFGDLAFRLNVLAALFGALAATAVFFLVRGLGQYKPLAVFAALFFGFLPAVWDLATEAGVQTMTVSLLAAALALAVHGARLGDRRLLALAFCAGGLATAVDLAGLLALPVLPLVLCSAGPRSRRSPMLWALCAGAFLLPLLFYLYIPLRAGAGHPFLAYLGQAWRGGGTTDWAPAQGWLAVRAAAAILVTEFGGAGVLLALVGGWALWVRRRWAASGLALLILLNLALAAVRGCAVGLPLIHRHLLPAWLAVAVCLAVGAQYLAGLAAHALVREKRLPLPVFTGLIWILLLAVPASRCLLHYPLQDKSGIAPAADHGYNLLATMPEGSHLVTDDRLDLNPVLYLTRVNGLRSDLTLHDRMDDLDTGLIAGETGPVFFTRRVNPRIRVERAGVLLAASGTGWTGDSEDLFRAYHLTAENRIRRGRIWREARQVLAGYRLGEAEMYRSWGLDRRAGEALRRAVAIGHDSSRVLRLAAVAHAEAGAADEAVRLLERALKLNPADEAVRLELAALLAARAGG
jgi:hypothetical protein